MSDFHIIIPARLHSTRLPGKMLLDVAGKPLIQRVYERALRCQAASITIATDDEKIRSVAEAFGARTFMTSVDHPNGTSRLAEAAEILGLASQNIVLCMQGDEPLVPVKAIEAIVAAMHANPSASATTLATPIRDLHELSDPNAVKVVLDKQGFALYFSRSTIPFDRDSRVLSLNTSPAVYHRHLGLYVYRVATLKKYRDWLPSPLEVLESLEQLRLLWQGEKIHVTVIDEPLPAGVDTDIDLVRVSAHFFESQRVI